jgi:hypothetical protein
MLGHLFDYIYKSSSRITEEIVPIKRFFKENRDFNMKKLDRLRRRF